MVFSLPLHFGLWRFLLLFLSFSHFPFLVLLFLFTYKFPFVGFDFFFCYGRSLFFSLYLPTIQSPAMLSLFLVYVFLSSFFCNLLTFSMFPLLVLAAPPTFGLVLLSPSLLLAGGAFLPSSFLSGGAFSSLPFGSGGALSSFGGRAVPLSPLGKWCHPRHSIGWCCFPLPSLTWCNTRCSIRLYHRVEINFLINLIRFSFRGGKHHHPKEEGAKAEPAHRGGCEGHRHPKRGGGESTATQRRSRKATPKEETVKATPPTRERENQTETVFAASRKQGREEEEGCAVCGFYCAFVLVRGSPLVCWLHLGGF